MNNMTTKEQIELYLKDLPSKWKDQLTILLCQIAADKAVPDCDTVKECETLTSLSPFTTSGNTASIKYTDEEGTQLTRTFDLNEVLNNSLEGLDPMCLTSPTTWNTLSYVQRMQLLITEHCECCD